MKFEHLMLANGHPLQLQISNAIGMPERYACQLIGHVVGRSVLVSVPKKAGHLLRFRSGQKVVVRFIADNGVGVFIAQVDIQTADPYPILHLSYPDKVTFKGIRNSVRIKVALPASFSRMGKEGVTPCQVVDMSESGCRIEALAGTAEIGDQIKLELPIKIQNIERVLMLAGVLRSQVGSGPQVTGTRVGYGIEFLKIDDDTKLILLAFVFGEIVQQQVSIA